MGGRPVYVDVLILLNFIVDYFLVLGMQLLCRRRPCRRRLLLAAAVGSLFSLTLFLPSLSQGGELGCKLLSCAVMVRLADRWGGWRRFLHGWAALVGVSFLYAGAMLALRLSLGPGRLLCANGVVYFHMSPLVLLCGITLGFVLMGVLRRFFCDNTPQPLLYDCELHLCGGCVRCRGLVDSGNHLREPFSGEPVVVACLDTLRQALPPPVLRAVCGDLTKAQAPPPGTGLRLVPYTGVECGGILPAIRGERLLLRREGTQLEIERFYVAVSRQPVGTQEYQLLLSGELADTKRERLGVMVCCKK